MIEKGHCRIENCIYYLDGSNGSLNNCKKVSGVYLHSWGCAAFSDDPQDLNDEDLNDEDLTDPTN